MPSFVNIAPWTDLEAYAQRGHCSLIHHSADSVAGLTESELASRIKNMLNCGHHVEAYVDEYYIPETRSFRKGHCNHAFLITGHDESEKVFLGVIYRTEGRFGLIAVPSNLLGKGIFNQRLLNAPFTAGKALREIAVCVSGCEKLPKNAG